MSDYFTTDHFKLLNKWKGQKWDPSNPEQRQAYDELKKAYAITEEWALGVKEVLFPDGEVDVRKKPTSQASKFQEYNWARIYPAENSPRNLAYTVGINAENLFVVKIDTVAAEKIPGLRQKYEQLRGAKDDSSPFVATLPSLDGLSWNMEKLVAWSVDKIRRFRLTYEDVVEQLGLTLENTSRVAEDEEAVTIEPEAGEIINRIYVGPPGTGKTYAILDLLKADYTSHVAAMSPEEWSQGQLAEKIPNWTWWEVMAAALYDLGRPTSVIDLATDFSYIGCYGAQKKAPHQPRSLS